VPRSITRWRSIAFSKSEHNLIQRRFLVPWTSYNIFVICGNVTAKDRRWFLGLGRKIFQMKGLVCKETVELLWQGSKTQKSGIKQVELPMSNFHHKIDCRPDALGIDPLPPNEISNSNWTEWSTIQGVIMRVISNWPSTKPIWNYEHDYFLNCTTRSPITN